MRSLLVSAVVALALIGAVPAPGVLAQEGTTTTAPESGGIIPEVNSGNEPTDSGDRGGSLQTVVFVVMLAGVGVIGVLVVRESRKARAARGF